MEKDFDINRDKVQIYEIIIVAATLLICSIMTLPLVLVMFIGPAWRLGIFLLIAWFIGLSIAGGYIYLTPLRTKALLYCLESKTLKVHKGIIFKSRKSIPLEKITDVELVQGPLLWVLGMWSLNIQTASTAQLTPEATLVGCVYPEQVRDDVLTARDEYMRGLTYR